MNLTQTHHFVSVKFYCLITLISRTVQIFFTQVHKFYYSETSQ